MSLKKIIDNIHGIELDFGPGNYLEFKYMFYSESCRILNMFVIPTKDVGLSNDDYFVAEIYNIGFNNEKQILVARFTNKTNDVNGLVLNKFKANLINIFHNIIGKGEFIKLVIKSYAPINNINLGYLNHISEIESL